MRRRHNAAAMKKIPLFVWMLSALFFGGVTGALLQPMPESHGLRVFLWNAFDLTGKIFLASLKMVVLPLVATSLVSGMAGLGAMGKTGRVGFKTFGFYMTTTMLAVLTGLLLVNLIQPGVGAPLKLAEAAPPVAAPERLTDLLLTIVPENIFAAMAKFEMLSVIFFALIFGLALNFVSLQARERVLSLAESVLEVMMKITGVVIRLAPVGIFALVAKLVAGIGYGSLVHLIPYALTVASGLAIHFLVTLPLLAFLLARVNPFRLMQAMSEALLTAFSTASSAATLPLTMQRAEKQAGVSNRVASFVLPMGATVNMDGTALYEAVAVMFIAQVLGVAMTMAQQLTIFAGAVLVSIGAAAIPHAGLVMMTIILASVGLPLEYTALIWPMDRLLDMCRTMTNVWSDVVGSVVIASSEGELDRAALGKA
jgi:Na+/H+-dicarboxylate symporter